MGQPSIYEYLDLEALKEVLNSFSRIIDLPIFVVDHEGNIVLSPKPLPLSLESIKKTDLYKNFLKDNIFNPEVQDPLGFVNLIEPIMAGSYVVGALIFTRILKQKPSSLTETAKATGLEEQELLEDINKYSVNYDKLEEYKKQLSVLRNLLSLTVKSHEKSKLILKLELLQKITNLCQSTMDLDTIMQQSIHFVTKTFNLKNCSITLLETNKRYSYDKINPEIETIILNEIIKSNILIKISNTSTDILLKNFKTDPLTIYSLPLVFNKELLGTLTIYIDVNQIITEEGFNLLSTIANQLSISISNAINYAITQQSAITDKLTGLHNKAYFDDVIKKEISRTTRLKKPISLILFDLDDFKQYNDSYGHLKGDDLLRKIGWILRNTVRNADSNFRYGGEEFIVLLPETDQKEAFRVAERLRVNVENENFERKVTISTGLVTCMNPNLTAKEILNEADKALYKAKRSGKNRVVARLIVDKAILDIDDINKAYRIV